MLILQGDRMDNLLVSGSDSAPLRVLLAHGAGAGMDSPFMAAMADGLAEQGWQVLRFNFLTCSGNAAAASVRRQSRGSVGQLSRSGEGTGP